MASILTIAAPTGQMRGRNRYTRLATLSVDAFGRPSTGERVVRVEARTQRYAALAPAWLEMSADDARTFAQALLREAGPA